MKTSADVFGWYLKATDGLKVGTISPPVPKATDTGEPTHFYLSRRRVNGQSCHSTAVVLKFLCPRGGKCTISAWRKGHRGPIPALGVGGGFAQ